MKTYSIFETHAHYDDEAFEPDRDGLLSSLQGNGIGTVVNVCASVGELGRTIALTEKYPFVYGAVGVHPDDADKMTEQTLNEIRELSRREKILAIGEIGLDYYWDKDHKEIQHRMFDSQLALARELGKPVIVHDREAHADCLDMTARFPEVTGVFHCYSGSVEMAEILLKRGWYLGFDGPITYKNARRVLEVLEACPLDRILVETDSPYLTPVPYRGKRNDSTRLRYTLEKVAEVKGVSFEEAERRTMENGCRLFGING